MFATILHTQRLQRHKSPHFRLVKLIEIISEYLGPTGIYITDYIFYRNHITYYSEELTYKVNPKRSWSVCQISGRTGFPSSIMTGNDWIKQNFQVLQDINSIIFSDRLRNISVQIFSQTWGENGDTCRGTLGLEICLEGAMRGPWALVQQKQVTLTCYTTVRAVNTFCKLQVCDFFDSVKQFALCH